MNDAAPPALALRPVRPDDEALLWRLYRVRRADEIARWPMPEAQIETLMRMQWRLERAGWAHDFPDAEHAVIVLDGADVGRIVIDRDAERVLVVDMTLLPELQGRGVGGRLFADLIARSAPRPVEVAMLRDARSRAFGEKLGFRVVASDALYLRMRSH